MVKWLEEFLKEIEEVKQIKEIEHEKKFHEIVVGIVPTDLQKFKTVFSKMVDSLNNTIRDHLEKHDDPNYNGEDCPEFHRTINTKIEKIVILNKIFWTELKEKIGYRPKDGYGIGVRSHWAVVEFDKDIYEEEMEDELDEIFGHFEKMINIFSLRPGSQN